MVLSKVLPYYANYIEKWERKSRFFLRLKWDAETGAPLATLFAQVALFTASLCLKKTRLCSEYDHSGIKTAILYHICAVLLCYANRWNQLEFFRRRRGIKVNSIANLICLILGIFLEKFYEKSLASLCFSLIMAILFLILVVIIQPKTDLGFFGFLVGATVSVAYNLFQLKLGTWIVVAICSLLVASKFCLDKNWLDLGELERPELESYRDYLLPIDLTERIASRLSNLIPAPVIETIDALIVAGFYFFWAAAFFSTNCLNSEYCTSCSAMEKLKCGAIYVLWMSPAHIHCLYSLFQVEFWVLWLWLTTSANRKAVVQAIAQVENIQNQIKRLEEARHPKNASVVVEAMGKARIGLKRNHDDILTLYRHEGEQKLPEWVRKKIEKKFRFLVNIENKFFMSRTVEDTEAFYARALEFEELLPRQNEWMELPSIDMEWDLSSNFS